MRSLFPSLPRTRATQRPVRPDHAPALALSLRFCCFCLFAIAMAGHASAEAIRNCVPGSSDALCRLSSVLHALYVVASVLAIILVVVIVLAVRLYQRNKADGRRVL